MPREEAESEFIYVTQECAMAPGIARGWPEIIPAPHTKNGRLVRMNAADFVAERTRSLEAQIQELQLTIRKELWLNHGHLGLYGDDGEMQCAECGSGFRLSDYKRAPFERVLEVAQLARLKRTANRDFTDWKTRAEFAEAKNKRLRALIELLELLQEVK